MNEYPTIELLLRRRRVLPAALSAASVLAGVWISFRTGVPDFAVAGLPIAAIMFFLAKSYLELISVISDMLIPK